MKSTILDIVNQRGIAQIIVILILLAGLAAGLFLVQNPVNWLPKAYEKISKDRFKPRVDKLQNITNEWTIIVNGETNGGDHGKAIVLDKDGSIYTAGSVFGSKNSDIWIRKYDSSKNILWTKQINDFADYPENSSLLPTNQVLSLVVDNDNNLYAGGFVGANEVGSISNQGYLWITKFDSSGNIIWQDKESGLGKVKGLAVDTENNLYATGQAFFSQTANDIWIRKYNSSGQEVWTKTFTTDVISSVANRVLPGDDEGFAIAVSTDGNIYVTGYIDAFASQPTRWEDIRTTKLDSSGNVLWTKIFDSPDNDHDHGYGIATDTEGNAIVVGRSVRRGSDNDIYGKAIILKYSPSGELLITKFYDLTNNQNQEYQSIQTDGNNNIYIIGSKYQEGKNVDGWIQKYNPNLNLIWEDTFNGTTNGTDFGEDLAINSSGDIFAIGSVANTGTSNDISISKYKTSIQPTPSPTQSPTPSPTPEGKTPPCGSYGDVDQNGRITSEDSRIALKIFTGSIKMTDSKNADVDGDGTVTPVDARLIQRYVEGLETTFPVCTTSSLKQPKNQKRR